MTPLVLNQLVTLCRFAHQKRFNFALSTTAPIEAYYCAVGMPLVSPSYNSKITRNRQRGSR